MKTITIDIINEKAMRLLEDMEFLKLIRLHKQEDKKPKMKASDFLGLLTPEEAERFQAYLKEARNEWDRGF